MSQSHQSKTITRAVLRTWPLPQPAGDKEDRGCVLVIAGSPEMPGPVILAAIAALRAGAGKLQIATSQESITAVACAVPEALVVPFDRAADLAQRSDAIVFGPGMHDGESSALFEQIAKLDAPVVLDAQALRGAAEHAVPKRAVFTPHAGEMAALLQCERADVERDRLAALHAALERYDATIAFKGVETYIASRESQVYCNARGTPALGTSGSGDVLAGIIGGLLARGAPPLQAAVWGVFLHAQAGRRLEARSGLGFLAREIAAEIPPLLRALG